MDTLDKIEMQHILRLIAKDMENDVVEFNGKPFTGETVGTYFGDQGAAIAVLAKILNKVIDNLEVTHDNTTRS